MSEFIELCADEAKDYKEGIKFDAVVYKVQTLVDGGIRITFDLGEDAIMQAAELMECKRFGVPLIMIAYSK